MSGLTVLAATDLSPRSAQVGPRAAQVALALGARLVLAHVLPPAHPPGPMLAATGRPLRPLMARLGWVRRGLTHDAAAEALRALARDLALPVITRVLTGAPDQALAIEAQAQGATLLVLGLHRERRMLDALRLTTMERIVLAAPVPVLMAHRPGAAPYARVLALTDFALGSAASLRMAGRIAPGAAFHALHALHVPLVSAVADGADAEDDARTQAELLRRAFLAHPGLPPLAAPPELVPGPVHLVLDYRRRELDADLITIGTHSGRSRDELGPYARDLMRAPPTDLLVAKPGG